MARAVYDLQGYSIVLEKILFITRVFDAAAEEGYQFNVVFSKELKLSLRFPTRTEADLQRELLCKAVRES